MHGWVGDGWGDGWVRDGWMGGFAKVITVLGRFYPYKGGVKGFD
jgi:hypothetical protein